MPKKIPYTSEIELDEKADHFCAGLICRMKEDKELIEMIADKMVEKMKPELETIQAVAAVQKEHPRFKDMQKEVEEDKELNQPVKEDE